VACALLKAVPSGNLRVHPSARRDASAARTSTVSNAAGRYSSGAPWAHTPEALRRISSRLGAPVALLHKDRGRWRLIGDAGPVGLVAPPATLSAEFRDAAGTMWTGLAVSGRTEWVLVVPGPKAQWETHPDLDAILEAIAEELAAMSQGDKAGYLARAGCRAYALGRRLTRTDSVSGMYKAIVGAMASSIGGQYGALALFVRREGALRISATYGYPDSIVEHIRILPGEGILGQVFASGRALLVGPGAPHVALPHRPRYRTQSCIVMPLTTKTGVLGVVAVADPRDGDHFDRTDMRALRLFVPPAVLALERELRREEVAEVSEAAIIDYVTGLANRQYLESRLHAEMHRAARLQQPLAVMLIDVDNFKQVNDTFGHLEGDRVLRDIATVLSENVRSFDVCTRYGGEEFAILMPGAEQRVAIQVAERVRRAVEQTCGDAQTGVRITVSAGVALLSPGDTPDGLLRRTDRALLRAKAEGKNAVRSE
jgi:diguanylate cyclase (GGDEF)-like protein